MILFRIIIISLITFAACYSVFFPVADWNKQNRFLLMMSTFKRPIFASGQVLRFMNQTYQNFDISISMKGVDRKYSALTFEKDFTELIDKKRLFLRYDTNSNQLTNLLDTVRDIDLEKYDYFCKIDDDDWYAPEYLQNVNDEINSDTKGNEEIYLSSTVNTYILDENISSTYMFYNRYNYTGPTMCFSRGVIQMALEAEKNPEMFRRILPDTNEFLKYAHEDGLLAHLSSYWGRSHARMSSEPLVIYGWQYRSVMRNRNYVDFFKKQLDKKDEKM